MLVQNQRLFVKNFKYVNFYKKGLTIHNNSAEQSKNKVKQYTKNVLERYQNRYNEIFGINLIEKYYANLQQIEKDIILTYERRRGIQDQLNEIQTKIKEIRFEMDKLPRNHDNYIHLFTKEHGLLKSEFELLKELRKEEEKEHRLLTMFSENIRKSYQIELERQLKQKNLNYIYYMISTSLAILGFMLGFLHNRNSATTITINDWESFINDEKRKIESVRDELGQRHLQTIAQLQTIEKELKILKSFEQDNRVGEHSIDWSTIAKASVYFGVTLVVLKNFF